MNVLDIVIILGAPCTGKMTVGQELAKLTGYKLSINHNTIEPVISTLGFIHWPTVLKLRSVLYDALYAMNVDGVIITFAMVYDDPSDWKLLEDIESHFPGADFYFVELKASLETRLERANTENRLQHKPSQRDVEAVRRRLVDSMLEHDYTYVATSKDFHGYPFLSLENDNLCAECAAQLIVEKFVLTR